MAHAIDGVSFGTNKHALSFCDLYPVMNLDDAVTFSTISLQDIASSELCWVLEDEEGREQGWIFAIKCLICFQELLLNAKRYLRWATTYKYPFMIHWLTPMLASMQQIFVSFKPQMFQMQRSQISEPTCKFSKTQKDHHRKMLTNLFIFNEHIVLSFCNYLLYKCAQTSKKTDSSCMDAVNQIGSAISLINHAVTRIWSSQLVVQTPSGHGQLCERH